MILPLLLACADPAGERAAPVVTQAAAPSAPDIVLVGVAGLRSDSLTRSSEWFLSPFSGEHGLVFSDAYAQTPSTFVSLGSVLTGRYPSAIPLCGFPTDPGAAAGDAPWCTHLPADVPTLPGVLALYGYRTALVTADIPGASSLATAFQDHFVVSERWDDTATDWKAVGSAARDWWTKDATKPRLLVIATADLDVRHVPALRTAAGLDFGDVPGMPARIDRAKVTDAYRKATRATGQHVKEILDDLRGGSPRPVWSALFGTNGINLGDAFVPSQALREGSWSDIVMDRTIHVPLALVGPPDAPPARVEGQVVELVDLLPTLLHLAGAVVPAGIPGQDLLATPFPADPAATAYAEFGDMLAVRQGTRLWSLRAFFFNRSSLDPELTNFILDFKPDEHFYALHDLASDPFQERNLLGQQPDEARRMHALLVKLRTGPGAPPEGALDAKRIWELRMSPADGYW